VYPFVLAAVLWWRMRQPGNIIPRPISALCEKCFAPVMQMCKACGAEVRKCFASVTQMCKACGAEVRKCFAPVTQMCKSCGAEVRKCFAPVTQMCKSCSETGFGRALFLLAYALIYPAVDSLLFNVPRATPMTLIVLLAQFLVPPRCCPSLAGCKLYAALGALVLGSLVLSILYATFTRQNRGPFLDVTLVYPFVLVAVLWWRMRQPGNIIPPCLPPPTPEHVSPATQMCKTLGAAVSRTCGKAASVTDPCINVSKTCLKSIYEKCGNQFEQVKVAVQGWSSMSKDDQTNSVANLFEGLGKQVSTFSDRVKKWFKAVWTFNLPKFLFYDLPDKINKKLKEHESKYTDFAYFHAAIYERNLETAMEISAKSKSPRAERLLRKSSVLEKIRSSGNLLGATTCAIAAYSAYVVLIPEADQDVWESYPIAVLAFYVGMVVVGNFLNFFDCVSKGLILSLLTKKLTDKALTKYPQDETESGLEAAEAMSPLIKSVESLSSDLKIDLKEELDKQLKNAKDFSDDKQKQRKKAYSDYYDQQIEGYKQLIDEEEGTANDGEGPTDDDFKQHCRQDAKESAKKKLSELKLELEQLEEKKAERIQEFQEMMDNEKEAIKELVGNGDASEEGADGEEGTGGEEGGQWWPW